MSDESGQPATKADISLLRAELATKTELREEIAGLDKKIVGLDKKIVRVAVELVNTQADIRRIEQSMATKKDVERIMDAIDSFAKKSENQENAVALHGHILTEVQVDVKDHEKRIKIIESVQL